MRSLLLVGFILALSACSHSFSPEMPAARPLLSPGELEQSVALEQVISFRINGENQQMLIYLDVTPDRLELLALDGFSTPLFKLDYDGEHLVKDSYVPIFDDQMAQFMLADMQLVYWPTAELNQQLNAMGWRVQDSECEQASRCRELYLHNELVTSVQFKGDSKWQANVMLKNLKASYQINISTLEAQIR
ncbi:MULTISPECIES: DUF3261 domain-containing protein [unclassified Agarivorans]|uniref:DUF3261 domain-containing protein n=1 Tax=unclassified Agarivorans TaxID=2636026 RepID=UPI0026E132C2|nr:MULTISPECIES: DUF3261 domain-containing protein [unclassified Agarivorans]MDO6685288.1 DUF3261 domain-containing protein [Agarivorans sp. 3_MG-2023]MDO6715540.1 DUF3261 domain-containing protein [Agarivorans sp. 2_MG-2023]